MELINATSTSDCDLPGSSSQPAPRQAKPSPPHDEWIDRKIQRWQWRFSPDWEPLLNGNGSPDWLHLENDQRATLVKVNDGRQVWCVQIGQKLVFAKIALPTKRWPRWRKVLRGSDAARELRIANYAAAHAIDTVHPVALAEAPINKIGPASVLITAGVPDAVPLNEFWSALDPASPSTRATKNQVIDVVAHLIAHAHQNGFEHLDLHAGNVLVQPRGEDGYRTLFVDLHNIRTAQPVSDESVTRNLAQFNQWFSLRALLTDRLRFLDRYLHWRDVVAADSDFARRLGYTRVQLLQSLSHAAHAHAKALYAKRDRRVMRTGRYYAQLKLEKRWQGHVFLFAKHPVPGSRASLLQFTVKQWADWLRDPIERIKTTPRRSIIKDSSSATVCRVQLPIENHEPLEIVIKRAIPRNLLKRIKNTFRTSRAMLTWQRANALLNRQVPTARPLAVLERRRFGLLRDSLIITEYIAHASDLDTVLTVQMRELSEPQQRALKKTLLVSLVDVVRRLHERGFTHRDLKAPNIMVQWNSQSDEPLRVMLVDLDGIRQGRYPRHQAYLKAIMRLNVSLDHCRRVSLTDRLRFLKQYLSRPGRPDPDWKPVWREIADLAELKRQVQSRHQKRMLKKYGRI